MLFIGNPIEPMGKLLELSKLSIIIRPYTKPIALKPALELVEFQVSSWQLDLEIKDLRNNDMEKQILGAIENTWDEIP